MMQPRISMITLGMKILSKFAEFYQQGLGLSLREPQRSDVAFIDLNGTWLGIYTWKKLAEGAGVPQKGAGFQGVIMAHNVKSKAEVDALLTQAVQAGDTLVKPAQDVFLGSYTG